MQTLRFTDALRLVAKSISDERLPKDPQIGVIRDIFGRLRFAIDAHKPLSLVELSEDEGNVVEGGRYSEDAHQILFEATTQLGNYATSKQVLYREDFANPKAIFENPDWHETLVPGYIDSDAVEHPELAIRLLDRQIVGQDWLRTDRQPRTESAPPRVVFYGLKGGVGRSSALTMLAYGLAREGKRVLLLDLDLESPGLSGLLLPSDRVAEFGIVDWLIEDAVHRDESILANLVADSPLGNSTSGAIRVAAAMGAKESCYLAKLARVYADVPTSKGPERFAQRLTRMVLALEEQEKPDVVLIDSRAGLHDLAAISIATLADLALLFATDSEQNWQGYTQLFENWRQRPDVLRGVRERLWIVRAMFPETEQKLRFEKFVERSYDLFAEHLYDEVDPDTPQDEELFSYAMDNELAPHFPLPVRWNARFMEFDPLTIESHGGIDNTDVDLAFGPFIRGVQSAIFEE